ncbi:protein DBF4 homolog A [Spea bombifrons]|uniref:protein DBF4 homolog A n=1 Tax=Spea bombifrons TaxID=233779 RepID=UPI002348FFCB|nr:protein DBF4 homolog A [Spea bombifrons]
MKLAAEKKAQEKIPQDVNKPFAGKVFYLDLPFKLMSEKLERDIKELGGTVEGFLSREISYLITNKKEARCAKTLKFMCSSQSPEYAQNSGESSNQQHSKRGSLEGSFQKKPEKGLASRGKSLVKKAIKEQEILPKNSILSNAWNWGVKILHVEEAKYYIEQKKKTLINAKKSQPPDKSVTKRPVRRKVKPQKLKSPYLKVEDNDCQYRPLYLVLPFFRSFQSPKANPSVEVNKKSNMVPKETDAKQSANKKICGPDGGNAHFRLREQKKKGYCECCLKKYEDLESHILSQQHKNFAKGTHYQDVDKLTSAFEFDFVDWSKSRNETKSMGMWISAKDPRRKEPEIDQIKFISQRNHSQSMEVAIVQEIHSKEQPAVVHPTKTICYTEPVPSFTSPAGFVQNTNCASNTTPLLHEFMDATPVHLKAGLPVSIGDVEMLSVYNENNPNETFERDIQEFNVLCESNKSNGNLQKCVPLSVDNTPDERNKLNQSLRDLVMDYKTSHFTEDAAHTLVRTATDVQQEENTEHNVIPEQPQFEKQPEEETHHLSDGSPPSKLHRKVKMLGRRNGKDDLCCRLQYKVSVAQDTNLVYPPEDSLMALFESSKGESEFFGFTCRSMSGVCSTEDYQEHSEREMLWDMFSHTSSTASTFNGF